MPAASCVKEGELGVNAVRERYTEAGFLRCSEEKSSVTQESGIQIDGSVYAIIGELELKGVSEGLYLCLPCGIGPKREGSA